MFKNMGKREKGLEIAYWVCIGISLICYLVMIYSNSLFALVTGTITVGLSFVLIPFLSVVGAIEDNTKAIKENKQ